MDNNAVIIEKIEINSFGKLKNVSLEPSEGANITELPNESGKSTLAAFIKFIFYGFAGLKKQTLNENERKMYLPWDGSPAQGAINLFAGTSHYRVTRVADTKNDKAEVTDLITGKTVFAGEIPGNAIFGIGEETFGRTLFVSQLSQKCNGDPALAEQLRNLLFSADEKTNVERAADKLKKARTYLKYAQRGLIPTLENKASEYEKRLGLASSMNKELEGVRVSLKDKKEQISSSQSDLVKLEAELTNIDKYEAGMKLEAMAASRRKAGEAKQRLEDLQSQLNCGNELDMELVHALSDDYAELLRSESRMDEITAEIDTEAKELDSIKKSSPFFKADAAGISRRASRSRIVAYTAFVLGAVCAIASAFVFASNGKEFLPWLLLSVGILLALYGGITAIGNKKLASSMGFSSVSGLIEGAAGFAVVREKARSAESRIASLEKRYAGEASSHDSLSSSIKKRVDEYLPGQNGGYNTSIKRIYDISTELGGVKADYLNADEQCRKLCDGVDESALRTFSEGAVVPSRTRTEAEREANFTRSKLSSLRDAELALEKRCSSLEAQCEDPAVLYAKLEITEKKLDEAKLKYRAVDLALSVLDESCDYMKSTVSPKLAELSGGYMEQASGGRYEKIGLTTDLVMSYDDGGMTRDADSLSAGAKDTAYFCMRMGLIDLIYDKKRPFMIFDDAFSRLDDNRLRLALNVLRSYQGQVFIMTCSPRERNMAELMSYGVRELRF